MHAFPTAPPGISMLDGNKPTPHGYGINAGSSLADSLRALWPGWENAGSQWQSVVGNGRVAGTLINGPTWVVSDHGIVLQVSSGGGAQYVNVPDDPLLNFGANDFAIGVWFNISTSSNNYLVGKGSFSSGTGGNGKRYEIIIDDLLGTDKLRFSIDDDTTRKDVASDASEFNDGLWHFVMGVRDENNLRLYVDGKEHANSPTDITGYGGLDDTTHPFRFGANPQVLTPSMDGLLEMGMLFNSAPSPVEIKDLFENPYRLITPDTQTIVTANLEETLSLSAAITVNGNISANLVRNKLTLTSDIVSGTVVVADLEETSFLSATIVVSGDISTADLVRNKLALTTDITSGAIVVADLEETSFLSATITINGNIGANLVRNKLALTADITGNVVVVANLEETSFLSTAITVNGNIGADLVRNKLALTTNITVSGSIVANLLGVAGLTSALTGNSFLVGNLTRKVLLSVNVNGSAQIGANLRQRVRFGADIIDTGFLAASLNRIRTISGSVTTNVIVRAELTEVSATSPWFRTAGAINRILD